eukprot:9431584-Pyramimonas_sp.AAC.1
MVPEFCLHGPVVIQPWHPQWLGAREPTNNTGELSALGELMHWLLEEAPDSGREPIEVFYDSQYAANIAQGRWDPKSNAELAAKVRELTQRVEEARVVTWTHVYGRTGNHGNELADRLADQGARGEVSLDSRRWNL